LNFVAATLTINEGLPQAYEAAFLVPSYRVFQNLSFLSFHFFFVLNKVIILLHSNESIILRDSRHIHGKILFLLSDVNFLTDILHFFR
jgi:hypothetical protein